MEIIYGIIGKKYFTEPTSCALGFFDGIHIGHQKLISILNEVSSSMNLKSMVYTFEKHPMFLLDKENSPKLIIDNITKSHIFRDLGIDILNYNKVSMELLNTSPEVFLNEILVKQYNVKAIVAGFNFKYGFGGKGESNLLLDFGKRMNIDVRIVEPVCIDGIIVSSTAIRNFLCDGNIKMANKLLGRNYSIRGKVVHGKQRGRKIGFPTANLDISNDLLIPKRGVYVTKAKVDNVEKIAITNIGYNPTFANSSMTIETHIINYDNDIYDKEIEVIFFDRIRDEVTFLSVDDLYKQINADKFYAIKYFN